MGAYIRIEDLHKSFKNKNEKTEVLKGIDLGINKGEIYGIVGFSGAGKSTLVRCINRLEEPDSGKVFLEVYREFRQEHTYSGGGGI